MSNGKGAGTGLWLLGLVALMGVGAYAGMAWQKGSIDPMVLLLGPTHSDPEAKYAAEKQARMEPELSEELAAAQYEPGEDEGDVDSSSEMPLSIDADEEASDQPAIQQAGFEEEAQAEEAEAAVPAKDPAPRTAARVRDTETSSDTGSVKKKSPRATARE